MSELAQVLTAPAPESGRRSLPLRIWALGLLGPGLMVMLADTDVGSVVTAAQSGARWGFRLLPLELLLIPALYLVMELTIRLGVATGRGHTELILERFGRPWALVSAATLLVSSTGALVTEFAGIAGVGAMLGLPSLVSVPLAALALGLVVCTGAYRRVELIGIVLGLFELAFLVAAALAHPSGAALARSMVAAQPLGDPAYAALVAANVGAVIMPWMVFYQQAAVVDKGLTPGDLRSARWNLGLGALATQAIMIAVLVASGAALFGHRPGPLDTVGQISNSLTPFLGALGGRTAFALGILGAALVASIVTSLASAWALAELAGRPRSLDLRVRQAPVFYGVYFGCLALAAVIVIASRGLVGLSVAAEVMNALLLPVVLGFLLALAFKALPRALRVGAVRGALLIVTTAAVVGAALAALIPALRS